MVVEPRDQFPVGMRVLAVDDDPTCLKLLDALLRRCQYHVTTTNQAITALQLLRNDKNKFDLVISDVHMPDMDGFKLLELVGLEMDLPVIMLSANGDPKLVMKGITHGACDYLLKPIRIEELKNIWQHVIRRRKTDFRDQSTSDNQDRPQNENGEGGVGSTRPLTSDGKLNKRRKEQNLNENEEHDENDYDNDDPSAQKKPRVVWSVELHQKFVAAVNQLGIDKAVPKKILDLMNVEKLTRENVASHLQKYRLYLKRISCVASQQANIVAALGSTDSPYLRIGNGFGNYHALAGSGQYHRTLGPFPPSGMLGRLNSSTGSLHGPYSPGLVQLGHGPNTNPHINDWHKFQQPVLFPGNQNGNMPQAMPVALEVDQPNHSKGISCIGEFSTIIGQPLNFSNAGGGVSNSKIAIGSTSDSLVGIPNKPFTVQDNARGTRCRQQFGNQSSSATVPSLNSEFSSHFLYDSRCDDNWQGVVQISAVQPNALPLGDCFKPVNLHPNGSRDNISSLSPIIGSHQSDASSITSAPPLLQEPITNSQCQEAKINCNAGENVKYRPSQGLNDQKPNGSNHLNIIFNSSCGIMGPQNQCLDPMNMNASRNVDSHFIAQRNLIDPSPMEREFERPAMEMLHKSKHGYLNPIWKPQNTYSNNNFGSLEDLVGGMMKQEEDNKANSMEGDFGCDAYSIGTCI